MQLGKLYSTYPRPKRAPREARPTLQISADQGCCSVAPCQSDERPRRRSCRGEDHEGGERLPEGVRSGTPRRGGADLATGVYTENCLNVPQPELQGRDDAKRAFFLRQCQKRAGGRAGWLHVAHNPRSLVQIQLPGTEKRRASESAIPRSLGSRGEIGARTASTWAVFQFDRTSSREASWMT